MNGQLDLGDMTIAVYPYKGKNPALLVSFKGETEIYKVATFKDKQTADWFVECVSEAIKGRKL